MIKYLALLRGINVGGNNIIKMADLKACFESMGFSDVSTYIQSGNVLFNSSIENKAELIDKIEHTLSEKFDYKSKIVLIADNHLKNVVLKAPKGFGTEPDKFRYDVLFLKEPLTAEEAVKNIQIREGVDDVHAGKEVLYFSRLISQAGQSYLNKLVGQAMYRNMTIRNWNTTSKLWERMNN